MSYTITVRTVNGQSEIVSESNVPDGEHQVNGHDDQARVDLGVTRRGPDGRFIAAASHSHSKES